MPGSLQDYLQRYDAPDEINSMGSDFTIIKQGICCYLALRKESNCVTGIDIQQPNPVMDRLGNNKNQPMLLMARSINSPYSMQIY